MLKLEGVVLNVQSFKSKKGKDLVFLHVYSDDLYKVIVTDLPSGVNVGEKVELLLKSNNQKQIFFAVGVNYGS